MPKTLILTGLILFLVTFYFLTVADMYLLSSVKREDILTNLQIIDSSAPTSATRKALLTTQREGKFAVVADTSIVFRQAVPITIDLTPVFRIPVSVAFAQDEAIQHIDTLYLSQSYNINLLLFLLVVVQLVCLLRWSKGRKTNGVFLWTLILLFTFLLGFQHFR